MSLSLFLSKKMVLRRSQEVRPKSSVKIGRSINEHLKLCARERRSLFYAFVLTELAENSSTLLKGQTVLVLFVLFHQKWRVSFNLTKRHIFISCHKSRSFQALAAAARYDWSFNKLTQLNWSTKPLTQNFSLERPRMSFSNNFARSSLIKHIKRKHTDSHAASI